jgi:zinc transport system ATP-binding protein
MCEHENATLLTVKNLVVSYANHRVLDKISFSVSQNDLLCIVGPNGSGKSTLLKCLLSLIKPNSGSIKFEEPLAPTKIGYMPQESKIDANFPASVYEIVSSATLNQKYRPFLSRKQKTQINNSLRTLGIYNLKRRAFGELSGGQRQKVLLARALCATDKLLILDEPSNNLDYASKLDFYNILRQLNSERGLSIIMVTHDLDHNNLLGNKVLSLDKDNPFFGNTEEYVRKIHAK